MIVVSGSLVLVAFVLLLVGLAGTGLGFVYASIVVSAGAFVFLLLGILQRRGDEPAAGARPPAPAAPGADEPAGDVQTGEPARPRPAQSGAVEPDPPVEDDDDVLEDDDEEYGGLVLVVPGRPRYHVDGCQYLSGRDVEVLDVLDAREEGFTPCGICTPDAVLAGEYDEYDDDEYEDADAAEPHGVAQADDRAAAVPPAAVGRPLRPLPARQVPVVDAERNGSVRQVPVDGAGPDTTPPARGEPLAAPVQPPAGEAAPGRGASAAGRARAVAAAVPTGPEHAGTVLAIPDRGRYHRADCRYVRDVRGTEELSRTQATRQGYAACGVCKP